MTEGTMAEFTIREVREGNESKILLIIHGTEVVAETKLTPITLHGNDIYLRLFEDTLTTIKPRLMVG